MSPNSKNLYTIAFNVTPEGCFKNLWVHSDPLVIMTEPLDITILFYCKILILLLHIIAK